MLPCPISQEGRGKIFSPALSSALVPTLFFSLQKLITFQKYTKQSDWHLSDLCTFLLSSREEVWAKECVGFGPVYFKLVFLKTGHMHVISPPQTPSDHLLTFNLTWQEDSGLEDKVWWWGRGRRERERDKPLQRESLQQDFSSVHMSEMMGPWLQNISSLESGFHRLPHWGLWQPLFLIRLSLQFPMLLNSYIVATSYHPRWAWSLSVVFILVSDWSGEYLHLMKQPKAQGMGKWWTNFTEKHFGDVGGQAYHSILCERTYSGSLSLHTKYAHVDKPRALSYWGWVMAM